ncbi:MAG: SDR family oxidoreductase [Actinomycetota bacterium]|nr:SDR family oxidoreductase [Actinomycetota bacterium]
MDPRPLALVTGVSRGPGIAAAVARRLAGDGWDLALTGWRPYDAGMRWGRHDDELDDLLLGLARTGMEVEYFDADLADPEAPAAVYDDTLAAFGRAPLALAVVHTHDTGGGLLDMTAADFDHHLAVNARATLLLAAEHARRFDGTRGRGRIVTFVSGLPLKGSVAYAASKGAIHWMTVSIAAELASRGITVNAINPGPTDTGWMSSSLREHIRSESPLGRPGRPEDAAGLVAWLLSDAGGWITGQVITSDGGWSTLT